METTNLTTNPQSEKRNNIKTCIVESWKVFALNTKLFFKNLWFHFLIAGLGFALFAVEATWFYTEYIQTSEAYLASGADPALVEANFSPSGAAYTTLIASILAFVVSNCIMFGAVFAQIRFYKATGEIAKSGPFTFWNEVKQDAMKSFIFDLMMVVIIAIYLSLNVLLAKHTSWWLLLIAIPVLIYVTVIGTSARLQYVVEKKRFSNALRGGFTFGHKKFGGYLILIVLTSIPMLIMAYAALLPTQVIQISFSADMISKLAGDPSGIPPYVTPLFIAVATFGYFILGVAYALQQWPLALYNSAVTRQHQNK